MQYYYIDASRKTVGPVSMDELRTLRQSGGISGSTPVILDGTSSWFTYDHYNEPHAPAPGAYPPPPPLTGRSTQDLTKERVVAGATQAAAAAGAVASLARDSLLETFRNVKTDSERAVVFGAGAGLFAFVLPWVGGFGGSLTGFGLARDASSLLWLYPITLGAIISLAHANVRAHARDRILRSRWVIVIGTFWSAITVLAVFAGRGLFGAASVGLYLALLSCVAITAGGIMEIADSTKVRPGNSP